MRRAGDDHGAIAPIPTTLSRRGLLGAAATAAAIGAVMPAAAAVPAAEWAVPGCGADDVVIRLCQRLIAVNLECQSITDRCHSLDDERILLPQRDALAAEHHELMDCLANLPDPLPRTRTGIRIMAQAAIALMPLDVDGRPDFGDQDPDAYLALTVAQAIAAGGDMSA